MAKKSNKLLKFWHELKRRNVFRVVAMYAGSAFVAIELTNNIVGPLGLPEWIPTVVILVLIIGLPVTAILSWIFDLTPEGVIKTEPYDESLENHASPVPARRRMRTSDIIISVLIVAVGILVYPKIFNKDDLRAVRGIDGRISIAVMPFENLSGDTIYNVWQGGLQNLLITSLSNSEELSVRKYLAVNNVVGTSKNVNIASLSPSFANDIAAKLDTRTLIIGNILKAGNEIRVNAQLVDAETEEIYKTYQVTGESENDIFRMADSLSGLIRNYIEIKKISDQYYSPEIKGNSLTNSAEAFKAFIHGYDAFKSIELESAGDWFLKAIELDSSFINAYVLLSFSKIMSGQPNQAKYWCKVAYNKKSGLPMEEELILDQLNAYFFGTPDEEIKYLKQLIEIDNLNPFYLHQLGFTYYKIQEYEDALKAWEEVFNIYEKWGTDYLNPYTYFLMGDAYHRVNEHKKEEDILELGISLMPAAVMIIQYQAICAFSQGDNQEAEKLLTDYKSVRQNVLHCTEAMISSGVGVIYSSVGLFDKAENYYRDAITLDPENLVWVRDFAWFLIDNDINIDEGLDLLETILELYPDDWTSLDAKGWGLHKQGKNEEALKLLTDAWDLRPAYVHSGFQHIKEIEQEIARQNNELEGTE